MCDYKPQCFCCCEDQHCPMQPHNSLSNADKTSSYKSIDRSSPKYSDKVECKKSSRKKDPNSSCLQKGPKTQQQKRSSNKTTYRKEHRSTTCKPKTASSQNTSKERVHKVKSDSLSASDGTLTSASIRNDCMMMEMIQKSIDQSIRAYFMHTMEKMECLSTQLLRNECLLTKMHLDIVEKISLLSERNKCQFQAMLERIKCILKEQSRRPKSFSCFPNEDEETFNLECDRCGYERSASGGSDKQLEHANSKMHYCEPQRNGGKHKSGEKLLHSSRDSYNVDEYSSYEKNIQCLHRALQRSVKELEESLKRLKQYKRKKDDQGELSDTMQRSQDDSYCNEQDNNFENMNTQYNSE